MSDQLRRYTFKLYPNSAQDAALREQARMCAQLWNALLEMRQRTVLSDAGGQALRFDVRRVNRWDLDDELHTIDMRSPIEASDGRERRIYAPDDIKRRSELMAKLRIRTMAARRQAAGESEVRSRFDFSSVDTSDLDEEIAAVKLRGAIIGLRRKLPVFDKATQTALKPLLKRKADRRRAAKLAAVGSSLKPATAFDQNRDLSLLRAECPEWAAQPRGTQERVAEMLDLAFKAFLKRASEGGRAAGYPKFKRVHDEHGSIVADSVHLREPVKSSWRFAPRQQFSLGKPGADGPCGAGPKRNSTSAKGESQVVSTGYAGAPAEAGGNGGERRICSVTLRPEAPTEAGGNGGGTRGNGDAWRLTMRGVPGAIKARGRFPIPPTAHKTADIRFYDGAWWFSICVAMPARRERGAEPIRVALDLIDEFASVTGANGQCVPGLSDPFSDGGKGESFPHDKGSPEGPGGCPANEGRPQDRGSPFSNCRPGGNPANEGGPQDVNLRRRPGRAGGNPANEGQPQAAQIQSARDRRFKRGSIRWTREKQRIARIKAREARRRREALHRWSTRIARLACDVEIAAPPKRALGTGRGDEQFPGAEVSTIASLNRRVLDQAPASAIQMLEYKLAEAGAACVVIRREDHEIRVGSVLRAATRSIRKAKRALKKAGSK